LLLSSLLIKRMLIKDKVLVVSYFLSILMNGCAFDIVNIKQIPTQMDSAQLIKSSFVLVNEVDVSLDTTYSSKLKSGTVWNFVGTISEGDVFKTKDQVLTIEGSNIFEAYIVLLSNKLVGFYLPVENTFSPIGDPLKLDFKKIASNL
jgi:hypothetical protein